VSIRRLTAVAPIVATTMLAVAACSVDVSPAATGLPQEIKNVMGDARYAHSRWGLLTYDFTTGKRGMALNENQFFIPGSTTKLFSLSAAWHTFGPDHRFTTPVYRQGTLNGGTLSGDLVLVASGDLTMGGRTKSDGTVDFANLDHADANAIPGATLTPENPLAGLDQIAQEVKKSGVTRVSGDVVIDDRLFEVDRDQNPEIPTTPIIVNDNLIDMVSTPTTVGQPAKLDYRPQTSAYTVTSKVTTVEAGKPARVEAKRVAPGPVECPPASHPRSCTSSRSPTRPPSHAAPSSTRWCGPGSPWTLRPPARTPPASSPPRARMRRGTRSPHTSHRRSPST
jgi:D-alanyl-D-alanine carboxypeptidase/D-alanyl-D-alanine-endopeptidase (penicillin-binding protein 4)